MRRQQTLEDVRTRLLAGAPVTRAALRVTLGRQPRGGHDKERRP